MIAKVKNYLSFSAFCHKFLLTTLLVQANQSGKGIIQGYHTQVQILSVSDAASRSEP